MLLLLAKSASAQTLSIYNNDFSNSSSVSITRTRGESMTVTSGLLSIKGNQGGTKGYEGYVVTANSITFYPGITYTISIKARTPNSTLGKIEITRGTTQANARSSSGNRILSSNTNNITATNPSTNFNEISTQFTVTSTQSLYIGFYLVSTGNGADADLDDIIITGTCNTSPTVNITNPAAVCTPSTVDLTESAIINGSTTNLTYTYFTDAAATTALNNPSAVTTSGTYYIKGTNAVGCFAIKPVVVTINTVPTAPTTTNADRCGTGKVTLRAVGAPSGSSYRWYDAFGDIISGETGPTYEPTISSTQNFYATVVRNGCESPKTLVTATVNSLPDAPTVSGIPLKAGTTEITVCTGSTATLTANGAPDGGSYKWFTTESDGTAISTNLSGTGNTTYSPTLINNTTSPIITSFYVEAINPSSLGGCTSATRTKVDITVNPLPTVTLGAITPVCVTATAFELTIGSPAGGSYSGTGVTAVSNPDQTTTWMFDPTVAGAGVHIITYTYQDPTTTCLNKATTPIQVSPVATAGTFAPVCSGSTLTLGTPTAPNLTGMTYTWTATNPANQGLLSANNVAQPIVTLTNPGTEPLDYTFNLEVNSPGCETTSSSVTITVKPAITSNNLTAPEKVTFCDSGDPAEITGTAAAGGNGIFSYVWESSTISTTAGFTQIIGATEINYNPGLLTKTTYFRRVVTSDGCPSTSNVITITINPNPTVAEIFGNGPVCVGKTINLTNNTPNGVWSSSDENIATVSSIGIVTGIRAGIVTISYEVTQNGCYNKATKSITVNALPPVSISGLPTGPIYSGDNNITLIGSPAGGTFKLNGMNIATTTTNGVTTAIFVPCNASTTSSNTITYEYNGTCANTATINVNVIKSVYRVIVRPVSFPVCPSVNTNYFATVVRDAEIIYPYKVNANGQAIDANNVPIVQDNSYPIPNPDYPFPTGTPQFKKDQAYRYFRPIVVSARDSLATNKLTYQWTKNDKVFNGPEDNGPTVKNSGLTSQDFYAAKITGLVSASNPLACNISASSIPMSNRIYLGIPNTYSISLAAQNTTFCRNQDGTVNFSTTLGAGFPTADATGLTINWYKNNLLIKDSNGNPVTGTTYSAPYSSFNNGDKISIAFTSAISGCSIVQTGGADAAINITVNPTIINSFTLQEPEETLYFKEATYIAKPTNTSIAWRYEWTINYLPGPNEVQTVTGSTLTIPADKMHLGFQSVTVKQIAPDGICFSEKTITASSNLNVIQPVELLYLKATKQANDVVAVEWATAMEQNSEGFEVQVSQDAKNYRSLAFVASKAGGNTNQKQVYTFHDKENGKYGTRYYRLMQRDINGDSEYFGPKAVKIGAAVESLSAYPNPFSSEVSLEFNAEEAGTMQVLVTDAAGAKILERSLPAAKGNNRTLLQLNSRLPQGMYIITTRLNGKTNHIKLLKR
ncbi:Ig-like domain-containing protein [Adhaeribacter rhizoryzae]|nr:T9SS type A sorting domain-containing protein [Adhaeribacter rhizoryzae]